MSDVATLESTQSVRGYHCMFQKVETSLNIKRMKPHSIQIHRLFVAVVCCRVVRKIATPLESPGKNYFMQFPHVVKNRTGMFDIPS